MTVLRLRRARAVAWSPHMLTRSVYRADWNADEYFRMTDDGAGVISTWADGISGITPTAATTLRPTWSATAWVGPDGVERPGVTFNGANALSATATGNIPVGAAASEVYLVANFTGSGIPFGYGRTDAQGRRISITGTTFRLQADNALSGQTVQIINPPNSGLGSLIARGYWSGTTVGIALNGGAMAFNTAITALNTPNDRLRLGSNLGASTGVFMNGVMRRLIVTTPLPEANRYRMEGYLAWDSGLQSLLPSGHPYKSARP